MIGVAQRNFLRQRAMALVMTILFIVAIVVTIGINSLIALPGVIWGFEPLAGLVVWCLFMLSIYRLVPNRTYPVRQLWPGVLIAGVAMEVLTLLWPVYTHFSKGSSPFGDGVRARVPARELAVLSRRVHPPGGGGEPHARRRAPCRGLLGQRLARRVPVRPGLVLVRGLRRGVFV